MTMNRRHAAARIAFRWMTVLVPCLVPCGCSRSSTTTSQTEQVSATAQPSSAPSCPHSDHVGPLLEPQPALEPIMLADSVGPLASDGSSLVWSTDDGIFRKTDTGTEKLSGERARSLAVHGTRMAWIRRSDSKSDAFEIWKGTLVPGGLGETRRIAKGTCSPRGLAVDAEHVYFTALCDGIVRVPWAGGRPETLLPPNVEDYVNSIVLADDNVALADNRIYWTNGKGVFTTSSAGPVSIVKGKSISAFAIDGDHLIWADGALGHDVIPPTGTLRRMPLAGGPITTLAERQIRVVAIVSYPSHVLWRTEVGAIRRVRKDGTGLTTLRETGCWGYELEKGLGKLYFEALLKDEVGRRCRPGVWELRIP